MKKLFLQLFLIIGLIGISYADPIKVHKNQQFNPFIKYIDVENLRLFSLEEVSNDFMAKVANTYLLMLKDNSQIDSAMRSKYLEIVKNNFIYQRIGLEGPEYYEKKLNNDFGSLPQSRTIEHGPYRDNVTDYIWEYKEGSDMQTNEVIEHLLHTITNVAFAIQFSDWNWEDPSSNIRLATKEAIDNGIFNISDYQEILNRGDTEGFYKAITTEFAYWLIAVEWGYGDFLELPNSEFRLRNQNEIAKTLPIGHRMYKCYVEKILSPPEFKNLFSIFPTNRKVAYEVKNNQFEEFDCSNVIDESNERKSNKDRVQKQQDSSDVNCDWNFNEIWDEYLELNNREFNSNGYLFIVKGGDGRCEYGMGQDENEAFNDCNKWKNENNIYGNCKLYAKGEEAMLNESLINTEKTKKSFNNNDIKLHELECMNESFDKFAEVFGVYVVGTPRASMSKVKHTAGVLAQYLDNDEDGIPDDSKISSYLSKNNYIVPVWSSRDREKFWENASGTVCEDNIGMAASMYYDEDQWALGGIEKTGQWDTNLEEVWHVVSSGWYEIYPKYFGNDRSMLHDAMDIARGGYFDKVPSTYPKNAWYSYNDQGCSYECQAHEYFYWILMANINALDKSYTDKCRPNDEWNICNKSELKNIDTLAFELLNNYNFMLPTKIPDGQYKVDIVNFY